MKNGFLSTAIIMSVLGGFLTTGISSADAKSKKPDEITCEDFLAMDVTNQNAVAYWVDGYYQSKNETEMSVVAYDKFAQPIAGLVEDCKKTPKETLWSKMKKHL